MFTVNHFNGPVSYSSEGFLKREFLGIQPSAVETTLAYKTKLVKRELCTVFLDTDSASDNSDDLAKTLYTLLFAWLNEHITNVSAVTTSTPSSVSLISPNFIQKCIFESHVDKYRTEGISRFVPSVPYFDNAELVDRTRRPTSRWWGNHSSFKVGPVDRSGSPTFTVNHFNGPVSYSSEGFLKRNLDSLNPNFVSLLCSSLAGASDGAEGVGSANPFVKGLFSAKAIATQAPPKNEDTIVSAQQPVKPMPGEFRAALGTLFETLSETQSWFVFCVNPNDSQLPNQLEGRSIKGQIRSLGLTEVSKRNVNVFEVGLTLDEFCTRYGEPMAKMGVMDGSAKEKVEQTRNVLGLQETDIVLGQYKVFLSQAAFHSLEDRLRSLDVEEQKRNRLRDAEAEAGLDVRSIGDPYAPYASPGLPPDDYADSYNQVSSQAHVPLVANASPFQRGNLYEDDYEDRKSFRSDDFDNRSRLTSNREETNSNYGSESYAPSRNMFQNADKEGLIAKEALAGDVGSSTLGLAMLAPNLVDTIHFPQWFGRMKREDVRQAWREKFALNVIIWFICACAVFVIAVLGVVICPTAHVFSTSELASHSFSNSANNVYTAIRGEVFDLTQIASTHQRVVSVIPTKSVLQYGGQDATNLFPVQVSALCNGVSGSVSPWVQLSAANTTDLNAQYHDFRAVSNDSRPDWYFESMTIMRWNNRVGYMGYTPQEISSMANTNGRALGIYDGLIYDLTEYVNFGPSVQGPHGEVAPSADSQFMDSTLVNLFKYSSGQDLTKAIDNLNIDSGTLAAQKTCLRNLFLIGMVDSRNSPQCLFSQYILLALSVMMVSIIAFKFIASINFGSPRAPEDHDKFVICQVPCYTEGEVLLRRTIDSLAQLKYDDKRKLILVVCDGNVEEQERDVPPAPNPSAAYITPPTTPNTPSPASSASPPTLPGVEDHTRQR
ncbi:P-loop containing nucleoside triphosphate hydrolase protein [Boletus edulis BED1]|uniref:P-loop containing nucleoside triphosphate hydrolase protein n=1 Tax=Boletus edulis BED1 TaxID=1328754 RepID=A0AAD4C3J8_BOLED|nr:P-loop containing nucleoside triphosphate hydrolase protein [Boletus edulis BED1]